MSFDPDARWRLHSQVAVRPEPFGALLYHFGTRKLSFLKNHTIVGILRSLPEHPTARAALDAAGVGDAAAYTEALAALARSRMLVRA
jgi:mycofactocin biosynthesis protein MftB